MSRLLRLYPRAWRERYGREVQEFLETEPLGLADRLDLIRGAFDAHRSPQSHLATRTTKGNAMQHPLRSAACRLLLAGEPRDRAYAVRMLGSSLFLALLGLLLQLRGVSLWSQVTLYAAFPLALVFSAHSLRQLESRDLALLGVKCTAILSFFWVVVRLADELPLLF